MEVMTKNHPYLSSPYLPDSNSYSLFKFVPITVQNTPNRAQPGAWRLRRADRPASFWSSMAATRRVAGRPPPDGPVPPALQKRLFWGADGETLSHGVISCSMSSSVVIRICFRIVPVQRVGCFETPCTGACPSIEASIILHHRKDPPCR